MIPLLTLSAGWGDPEPEGADISVAGLSPRRSQRWSVSVTGHSLRLEWLLVTAGHWWSLVSSNWSHSSVLQSGSAHSELVTVSSLLSLGPGRLGTGRGATDTAPPLPALATGGGRTFPPGHKPALATRAKWAKMLGGHGSLI